MKQSTANQGAVRKSSLSDEQQSELRALAHKYQLDLLLLFGSRAGGRVRPSSDYDFAVLDWSRPLTPEQEAHLAGELYLLFKTDAVDLVALRRAKPLLQFNAVRECLVLYEREPGLYLRYRWRACKHWEDSRKYLERKRLHVDRFLANAGL